MKDNIEVNALARQVPTDEARYNFFLFKHTHEGDYQESIGELSLNRATLKPLPVRASLEIYFLHMIFFQCLFIQCLNLIQTSM